LSNVKAAMPDIKELKVFGWPLQEPERVALEALEKQGVKEDLEQSTKDAMACEASKPKIKPGRKHAAPSGRDVIFAMLLSSI